MIYKALIFLKVTQLGFEYSNYQTDIQCLKKHSF